jgi:GH25 family lysozyme M1 (1,4-beta-N-acetylmuramidase)
MQGIDVSYVQGKIDWKRVKSNDVSFAVVKATQGRGEGVLTRFLRHFKDSHFEDNVVGANAENISVSVYHYFTATDTNTAIKEADYFLDAIEPFRVRITGYAAVDVESKYLKGMLPVKLAEVVDVFYRRVIERGYRPLVYTNPDFLVYKLPTSFAANHDIWLAHWGVTKPYSVPHMKMWQYGLGTMDGINGTVDLDIGYFEDNENKPTYNVGDMYTLKNGDVYSNGVRVPPRLYGRQYEIIRTKPNMILLGGIMSWVMI